MNPKNATSGCGGAGESAALQERRIGVAILAAISLLVFTAEPDAATPSEIAFSDFLARIEDQQVEEVTIEEGEIHGRLRDGGEFTTYAPVIADALIADLYDRGVAIRARPKVEPSAWAQILLAWLPILLIVGIFVFFVRQTQAGGGLLAPPAPVAPGPTSRTERLG